MDAEQLAQAMSIPVERAQRWVEPLRLAMEAYGITTPVRRAMFLAQIGHESGGLIRLEESLNYSAVGLANTWARFSSTGVRGGPPNDLARSLARQPEAIANVVYAGRMGNVAAGDGWRFRGRGPLQITGRHGYEMAQRAMPASIDLLADPDALARSEFAGAASAAAFWQRNRLNEIADSGDFDRVSDLINLGRWTPLKGDAIGFGDRLARFEAAKQVMA